MATKKIVKHEEVEISPPVKMDGKWTFKCNGDVVSKETFDSIMKDHSEYVAQQLKAAALADAPEKKTRKKAK